MTKSSRRVYAERTPESSRLHDEAKQHLPGGDSRSVTYHKPYPTFINSGSGCRLKTVDDESLIDFVNNYTQTVLGHAPERVVDAINNRISKGNGLGAPTEDVIRLAKLLSERIPSIDQARFANSGTEATMNAIRGAIAYTGCEEILKVQGGYHGTHDAVEIGVDGPDRANCGIPKSVEEHVHTTRFNDTEALKTAIENRGSDLACFIVEPIMGAGGMVPADREFLQTARDLTEANDIVLIFDEVMSFRLAYGGAQERYDVIPDLTALGKMIGGGLPVGAFGGHKDIMRVYHPENGEVDHSGTFNANPATMAGGVATLQEFDSDAIAHINTLGSEVRDGLRDIVAKVDIHIQITGEGSFFFLHFTDEEVRDATTSTAGCGHAHDLFMQLRNQGVFIAPRGMGNISTPMGDDEIDQLLTEIEKALFKLDKQLSAVA